MLLEAMTWPDAVIILGTLAFLTFLIWIGAR